MSDWPACNCGSPWPTDEPQEGLCSPYAKDHAPGCPRGAFLAEREGKIQRQTADRQSIEDAADAFAAQARAAFLRAGGWGGALTILAGPEEPEEAEG